MFLRRQQKRTVRRRLKNADADGVARGKSGRLRIMYGAWTVCKSRAFLYKTVRMHMESQVVSCYKNYIKEFKIVIHLKIKFSIDLFIDIYYNTTVRKRTSAVWTRGETGMAMEELLAVQELEKRLAEQYAEAQAEAKKRIAVEQRDRKSTRLNSSHTS